MVVCVVMRGRVNSTQPKLNHRLYLMIIGLPMKLFGADRLSLPISELVGADNLDKSHGRDPFSVNLSKYM